LVLLAQRSVLLRARTALARVERLMPGVRAEIVPGADHGLPLQYPELVNARILRFIEAEAPSLRAP
jgi:pimeloyl-ACP methyl ester carboxylesterase